MQGVTVWAAMPRLSFSHQRFVLAVDAGNAHCVLAIVWSLSDVRQSRWYENWNASVDRMATSTWKRHLNLKTHLLRLKTLQTPLSKLIHIGQRADSLSCCYIISSTVHQTHITSHWKNKNESHRHVTKMKKQLIFSGPHDKWFTLKLATLPTHC